MTKNEIDEIQKELSNNKELRDLIGIARECSTELIEAAAAALSDEGSRSVLDALVEMED